MPCSPLRTPADYDHAFGVVRQVIHGWDPYGLLAGGAPAEEWDGEIASLVAKLPEMLSSNDSAAAVCRVFSAAFQGEGFGLADCATVGQRLFLAAKAAGLLTPST